MSEHIHKWEEVYNGLKCECGAFLPDNGNYFAPEEDAPHCCHYCGKDLEDFSDLGCEFCDRRHPGYIGVL